MSSKLFLLEKTSFQKGISVQHSKQEVTKNVLENSYANEFSQFEPE